MAQMVMALSIKPFHLMTESVPERVEKENQLLLYKYHIKKDI